MKRLQRKIVLLCGALVGAVALTAVLAVPPGTFDATALAKLGGIGLVAALLLSTRLTRMVLTPIEQVRELADELATGRRDQRLRWFYRDERDAAAAALNRMADRLVREIDQAQSEAQQLEAVMAGMVEGVLVLDLSERILLVNPGFRELFDVWGPVRDRSLLEVIRLPAVEDLLRAAKSQAEPVVRDISVHGGSERKILGHAARFPSIGPPAGTLAVFHDVTEVRRVDQVRRDFIANASHELRTPLTSIQGYAETLQSGSLSEADRERCLATILRNVSRMRNLIDDLMDLSRIENDPSALERNRVDVARVARELLADLQRRLTSEQLTATIEAEGAAFAWGDRGAIEQILENLLTNAIRYTDAGGRIRVEISPKADVLEVAVEDDGIGIPEKSRSRIFERFYRVDAARSRALGSTGLGLSIVRHLVQAMGGTIRVESELGAGSRFVFTLPRAVDEEPSGVGDGGAPAAGDAETAGAVDQSAGGVDGPADAGRIADAER